MQLTNPGEWARRNWFFIALPLFGLIALQFARSINWALDGSAAERVILFDAVVSLPLLYYLCYRKTLSAGQMALRLLGLVCLGIWFATWLVPASAQSLLPQLGWARMAGIGILVVIELRLIVTALRVVFSGDATAEEVSKASGAPPLIAKLMLLEARFWRAVWRFIRGR